MDYALLEKINSVVSNRYEAVHLASKTARRLNHNRKKLEETGAPVEEQLPSHRVTQAALAELASGGVAFTRP